MDQNDNEEFTMDCVDFFAVAFGKGREEFGPFPYQHRLAVEPWPDLLNIPTGLGKTAAVVLAWLYKRHVSNDQHTPRRLVYCLPMRVLVEQTRESIVQWVHNLQAAGFLRSPVSIHVLMGGEEDVRRPEWADKIDQDLILIGTQDMLLSRALMRGYGMSRYQWPVHFALLNNDSLWVYDEVQLMQAGGPTSAQLEAFRRDFGTAYPSRSLWISATLRKEWLETVDLKRFSADFRTASLSDEDLRDSRVRALIDAEKPLRRADFALFDSTKDSVSDYVGAFADAIRNAHKGGTTLAIVNRVDRAQALGRALEGTASDVLLVHARFRAAERKHIEERLRAGGEDRIIVATQAVEAGVDISADTLFTELAPWSSLVQRFGRCNRDGRANRPCVYWIDIADAESIALPYTPERLKEARDHLHGLTNAAPSALPPVSPVGELHHVVRRRDFLQLFDTDADLSGFDIDISRFVRDTKDTDLLVFWRTLSEDAPPPDAPAPARDELCPVSISQFNAYRSKKKGARRIWRWDALMGRWAELREKSVFPGNVLMLDTAAGGYDRTQGFQPDSFEPVEVSPLKNGQSDSCDGEALTGTGTWVSLHQHLSETHETARALCEAIDPQALDAVGQAAWWHDIGKSHPAFQQALITGDAAYPPEEGVVWAKSPGMSKRPKYAVTDGDGNRVIRSHFRHELASMLAWMAHQSDHPAADLIAYLIVAHHGKVRMGLRALPNEKEPPNPTQRYARGVWDGDRLPALDLDGVSLPETELLLDLMELGSGVQGRSWAERTQHLLETHGPFRLAWLETLVRISDWRASRQGERGV